MTDVFSLMPGMTGYIPPSDGYALAVNAIVPRTGGRAAHWSDTETLATDWSAYLAHQRANPVSVGRKGRTVLPPLTILGFVSHAGVSRSTYYSTLRRDDDVSQMLQRIDNAIKDALISGALTRAYDSSITARVTGLADKTVSESTVTVDAAPDYDLCVLTDEELEQLHAITLKLERSITDVQA